LAHWFNLDLHVSVIADVSRIFATLGQQLTSWTLSAHAWVFGRERDKVDVVDQDSWRSLDAALCDAFHRRYRDELAGFDGFVVTHTPAFALLFRAWQKPVLIVNSTRYEQPFTLDPERWRWLDEQLVAGVRSGQFSIVSNNKGDQAYLREHTGLESTHIPSLCDYTGATHSGRRRRFILFGRGAELLPMPRSVRGLVRTPRQAFRSWLRPRPHTWQELYDHRGVVHLPYQISVMSLFEQYSASVPLFFPSPDFVVELHQRHPGQVLSELSMFQVHGQHYDGTGLNRTQDPEVLRRWVSLADYYDADNMPHIQYFDSFEHLAELLASVDTAEISARMQAFNRVRRDRIVGAWQRLLSGVEAGHPFAA
jgi:hypothetical protein